MKKLILTSLTFILVASCSAGDKDIDIIKKDTNYYEGVTRDKVYNVVFDRVEWEKVENPDDTDSYVVFNKDTQRLELLEENRTTYVYMHGYIGDNKLSMKWQILKNGDFEYHYDAELNGERISDDGINEVINNAYKNNTKVSMLDLESNITYR